MTGPESLKPGNRFRPRKRLGQHFIKDPRVIQRIIEEGEFQRDDRVLEIGPGFGALTIPLAGTVREIWAVEKDPHLARMLGEELDNRGIANVHLINEDILRLDWKRAAKGVQEKMKVVGNLPYNISSPLLERLLRHRDIISRAVLMFQVEFAKRLFSPPNCKDYGAVTVWIGYNAAVSPLFEVPKEAFYPRPKVGSMVISIDMEKPYPERAEDEVLFRNVVKGAFAHRRKTILNSLKRAFPTMSGDEMDAALRSCSIDPKRRAETLDTDEFLCLAAALKRRET